MRSGGAHLLFMTGVFIYFDLDSGAVSSGQLHVLEDSGVGRAEACEGAGCLQ